MAKRATQSKATETNAITVREAAEVPDFMRQHAGEGMEGMGQWRQTSRVKIIQAQTADELIDDFGVGTAIISPDSLIMAEYGEPVRLVPLFHYSSFALWRDNRDKDGLPVVEEVYNQTHPIAIKALNPAEREQPYDDGTNRLWRYVHHLNWVVEVQDGPARGAVAIVSFDRGSYSTGRKFINYLERREQKGAPLYGNIVELAVEKRTNRNDDRFFVFEFGTPSDGAQYVTDPEELKRLRDAYLSIKEAYEQGALRSAQDGQQVDGSAEEA